jgi:hypothetical protein
MMALSTNIATHMAADVSEKIKKSKIVPRSSRRLATSDKMPLMMKQMLAVMANAVSVTLLVATSKTTRQQPIMRWHVPKKMPHGRHGHSCAGFVSAEPNRGKVRTSASKIWMGGSSLLVTRETFFGRRYAALEEPLGVAHDRKRELPLRPMARLEVAHPAHEYGNYGPAMIGAPVTGCAVQAELLQHGRTRRANANCLTRALPPFFRSTR